MAGARACVEVRERGPELRWRGEVAVVLAVTSCATSPYLWVLSVPPGLVASTVGLLVWLSAWWERRWAGDHRTAPGDLELAAMRGRQAVILGSLPLLFWGGLYLASAAGLLG